MIYNSPASVALIGFEKLGGASGETAARGCDGVSLGFEYTTAIGSSSLAPG
jgi:hypothetical protein